MLKIEQAQLSPAARIAVAVLVVLGLIGGWLILLGGGFQHQLTRYSSETVFVDLLRRASLGIYAGVSAA